jgi:hypothetical protein
MNMLTTERLDEMAVNAQFVKDNRDDPDELLRVIDVIFLGSEDALALITAARMGVAWAECEAALPGVYFCDSGPLAVVLEQVADDYYASIECATGKNHEGHYGPTPTAALLALAAALKEKNGDV